MLRLGAARRSSTTQAALHAPHRLQGVPNPHTYGTQLEAAKAPAPELTDDAKLLKQPSCPCSPMLHAFAAREAAMSTPPMLTRLPVGGMP